MKLLLVRHADPDYTNDSLTPKGHAEARLLAESLLHVPLDAIYISPMGRAQLTAQYTLERIKREGVTLDWLAELNGNYRDRLWAWGLPPAEVIAPAQPYRVDAWREEIIYGEHMQGVLAPFYAQFDALLRWHGYVREGYRYRVQRATRETVAFFCHGGVIMTLLAHLVQVAVPIAYAQFACDPASITAIGMQETDGYAAARLLTLNDVSHLAPLKGPIHAQPFPRI